MKKCKLHPKSPIVVLVKVRIDIYTMVSVGEQNKQLKCPSTGAPKVLVQYLKTKYRSLFLEGFSR